MSIDQKNGFDDFFINENELPSRRDNQAGSRFAKFFAKREEEPVASTASNSEPRSISVNDLFGGRASVQQYTPPQQENNDVRVLSEDDILQSLGAKKNNDKPTTNDAMGFNRVLQILSQPKVTY